MRRKEEKSPFILLTRRSSGREEAARGGSRRLLLPLHLRGVRTAGSWKGSEKRWISREITKHFQTSPFSFSPSEEKERES